MIRDSPSLMVLKGVEMGYTYAQGYYHYHKRPETQKAIGCLKLFFQVFVGLFLFLFLMYLINTNPPWIFYILFLLIVASITAVWTIRFNRKKDREQEERNRIAWQQYLYQIQEQQQAEERRRHIAYQE